MLRVITLSWGPDIFHFFGKHKQDQSLVDSVIVSFDDFVGDMYLENLTELLLCGFSSDFKLEGTNYFYLSTFENNDVSEKKSCLRFL